MGIKIELKCAKYIDDVFDQLFLSFQMILCNPVCLIAYTVVSWKFFNERIQEEEIYLLNFFTEDYVEYKKRVGTGLPFITGFQGYYNHAYSF